MPRRDSGVPRCYAASRVIRQAQGRLIKPPMPSRRRRLRSIAPAGDLPGCRRWIRHSDPVTWKYQAAIIGGGPAGLQAALTLGRMHVETVVFDDGRYRNASSSVMGNVLGWAGAEPAALRAAVHEELAAYPWVRRVPERVETARETGAGWCSSPRARSGAPNASFSRAASTTRCCPSPGFANSGATSCCRAPTATVTSSRPPDRRHLRRGPRRACGRAATRAVVIRTVRRTGRCPVREPVGNRVRIDLRDGDAVEAACAFIPAERTRSIGDRGRSRIRSAPEGIEIDALGAPAERRVGSGRRREEGRFSNPPLRWSPRWRRG